MKKLITLAAMMMTAMFAKADTYLYWTVDMTGSNITGAQYAKLYASNDGSTYTSISSYYEIGSVNAAQSTIAGGVSASPYTNYLVALYNDALNQIAVSGNASSYGDIMQNTWNAAEAGTKPPSTPYSFSGFVVPEPTSGMMILLGVAALALKRRIR